MNLLLRLYPVPNGKIFIDGQDINSIPLKDLRDSICYITQDNFLFSTTLRENVKLFKDGYEEEDIKESTKNAMIYDDIEKMRNGIDTVLGEDGTNLSGGQKQRVVISRAFLNKSNIIIFDDVLSKVDNITKQKIKNNLRKYDKDVITIYITQDLSNIPSNATVFFIDNKKIIVSEQINLIEANKNYYNLIEICNNMIGGANEQI